MRAIQAALPGLEVVTPRKRFAPTEVVPEAASGEMPVVYGVEPSYQEIAGLRVAAGPLLHATRRAAAAPVCVLGEARGHGCSAPSDPLGRFVKVDEQWFEVIGVAAAAGASRRRRRPACRRRTATT